MGNFKFITTESARNMGILSQDDSTTFTTSKITLNGIKNRANLIYQDVIMNEMILHYPDDFEQLTYPTQAYRTTFIVSASSSGTTWVSTTPVFNNFDETLQIQLVPNGSTISGINAVTPSLTLKIQQYVNSTTIIADASYSSTYLGYTGLILTNEFPFNGDTTDLKEIMNLYIQLTPNSIYQPATLERRTVLPPRQINAYSLYNPVWYRTTQNVNGTHIRAAGVYPYPSDYRASYYFGYTRRVQPMVNDSDTPELENMGITEVIINGVTAWGLKIIDPESKIAYSFEEKDKAGDTKPRGMRQFVRNYRPVNRSQARKMKQGAFLNNMITRST